MLLKSFHNMSDVFEAHVACNIVASSLVHK